MKGCDIAWQKPSGASLHAAGFSVASLYVGQDNSGKNMTQAVVDDYMANGVGVVTNFEYGAMQMANGAPQGTSDARLGLEQKRACGIPDTRPIYYSADWAATGTQIQNGIIPYLVAARNVTGPGTVGVYGSYYVVSAVANYWEQHFPGEKVWLWQTAAWSNGLIDNRIDMYQDGTTVIVAGISVDNDKVLHTDVGQYPEPVVPLSNVSSTSYEEEEEVSYQIDSLSAKPGGEYAYSFPEGKYSVIGLCSDQFGGTATLRVVYWTPAGPSVHDGLVISSGLTVLNFDAPAQTYGVTIRREDDGPHPIALHFA